MRAFQLGCAIQRRLYNGQLVFRVADKLLAVVCDGLGQAVGTNGEGKRFGIQNIAVLLLLLHQLVGAPLEVFDHQLAGFAAVRNTGCKRSFISRRGNNFVGLSGFHRDAGYVLGEPLVHIGVHFRIGSGQRVLYAVQPNAGIRILLYKGD